jgi:hypothetical protein
MNDNPDHPVRRAPGQRWHGRRASLAVAGLMIVAALVAACGGGPASSRAAQGASGSPAASGSSSGSTYRSDLAYAACIRSHGVPKFPDPKPNGGFTMTTNPHDPQLQAAQRACASLLPAGQQQQTTGHFTPQQVAQLLTYARCMRSHGILNFPDPTSKGLGALNGIDMNSPQFQSASRACQQLLPAIGGNGNGPVSAPGGGS